MKVKVPKAGALEVLQLAQTVVAGGGRAGVSSLRDVLIKADATRGILLTATDYETAVLAPIPGEVAEPGEVVAPVERLTAILKETRGDTAEVRTTDEGHLRVEVAGAGYTVFCVKRETFPEVADPDPKGGATLPAAALLKMLRRTRFAAATERSRYTLNAVKFERRKGVLRLVATDGRRLAQMDCAAKGDLGAVALLPLKAAVILEQALAGAPEDAEAVCRTVDNRLVLSVGGVRLSALLLEGQYPDYESVLRKPGEPLAEAAAPDLLRAARQAALLADQSTLSLRVTLREGRALMRATSSGAGGGEADAEAEAAYAGPERSASLDAGMLQDILRAAEEDRVSIDMHSPGQAVIFRWGDWISVLMPITN